MKVALQTLPVSPPPLSLESEVKHLLAMVEYYLVERSLERPVERLYDAMTSLRKIVSRLVLEHFLRLDADREPDFCAAITTMLTERTEELPLSDVDRPHVEYLVEEILKSFEWAQEIKAEFPHDPVMQRIVSLDIPILDRFDFGLREKLHLVTADPR